MRVTRSLRGRITLSMGLILCVGLLAVAALQELEQDHGPGGPIWRLLLGDELPEPWQDLTVLLPFGVVVLVLIGVVCRWSLRPLRRVSMEAAHIGPQDPSGRIGTAGLPDELMPLVGAMNAALDRLATAYEVEQRFTTNAAHELRTPLATLSLRLQRIRHDGVPIDWPALEQDIAVMTTLVDKLLDLARQQGAAGRPARALPATDLRRAVRNAAAQMLPLVEAARRELVVELPNYLAIRGDTQDLRDAVRNLIENALRHGAGRIAIVGSRTQVGGVETIVLEVSDEGAGVPPETRSSMFERFRKGRQAGSGSGLGLAIVRDVVVRHGGTIAFVDGSRCIVQILLPSGSVPVLAKPARRMLLTASTLNASHH